MRYPTGFLVLFAIAGAQACGGASQTDFSTPAGGKSAGGTDASGGTDAGRGGSGDATSSGGTKSSGGTGGSSGSATGGSENAGGTTASGGSDASGGTSGTGGDAMGGTSGTGGDATGGTGADATGGTGADASGGTSGTGGDAMGGSAGTTGGSAGTTGGTGMNPDCAALEMDYSMTLQQAEACNPDSGKDQCTAMEKNDLTCPNCSVYVNPDNQAAIMHLAELRKQAGNHCVTPCPAIACVLPESATCSPVAGSKSAGRCTSQPLLK